MATVAPALGARFGEGEPNASITTCHNDAFAFKLDVKNDEMAKNGNKPVKSIENPFAMVVMVREEKRVES